ncbi:hypothetical protein G6F40_017204 [Rhizopus arrhizus]|nr:hypothetical protein G6F40_017204 [Rhizopus arrhizus]
MAGSMMSMSSRPNLPPSPACGFRPATATRGFSMPICRQARSASRMAVSSASGVMREMTSASATWMVTSSTRSSSLANIMAKSCVAERSARISVWPG